jgi:seryl-tRNA synthetase
MINLNELVKNPEIYKAEMVKRFKNPDVVDQLVKSVEITKPKQGELEMLRREKNIFNDVVVNLQGEEKMQKIAEMKQVSEKIKELESELTELNILQYNLLARVPNLTFSAIPVAKTDDGNVEIATYGKKLEYDFPVKHYFELPVFLRDYDSSKGVKAAGFRGFYIKGELAKLQKALFDWTLNRLIEKGFNYVIPPVFVNEDVMLGTGFFPDGKEDCYTVKSGEKDFYLPGTSEAALMFYHSDEIVEFTNNEPIKLTAYTRCFRKEAGSYGKDTKGGIRVNQFEKVETVLTSAFHETLDELGLYYHDLEVSSGDISIKNHRQMDVEAWFPAQNTFRELASSSNCTDYQTRTLNIKYKDENGEAKLTHSLNCTGITNRALFAIMEQFQNADGTITVPDVLVPLFGKSILS